jgi:hypothetical protein
MISAATLVLLLCSQGEGSAATTNLRSGNKYEAAAHMELAESFSLPSQFMSNLQQHKKLLAEPMSRADNLVLQFCNAGQFLDAKAVSCEHCPVGKYQTQSRSRYCQACPAGKYNLKIRSIKCLFNDCSSVHVSLVCVCSYLLLHHTPLT